MHLYTTKWKLNSSNYKVKNMEVGRNTSTSEDSVKISSGEAKEGPFCSLQQAPQPSTHCHVISFLLLKLFCLGLLSVVTLFGRCGRCAAEHATTGNGSARDAVAGDMIKQFQPISISLFTVPKLSRLRERRSTE